MRTAICTISTRSHLFKTEVLFSSLGEKSSAEFHCLLTDASQYPPETGIHYTLLTELEGDLANRIRKKYTGNPLRWSCKPLFLAHLLKQYDRVIYVDNDICFFSSPDFLFGLLNDEHTYGLLTPHFYSADPEKETHWLEANFRVGLYNAGFVAVSRKALPALEWWAKCCLYSIRQAAWRGLFDDQKYLDLMPVLFTGVQVLGHKGCNVAGWNPELCARSVDANGNLLLDERFPLVFIHFAPLTFRRILQGEDPLLFPYMHRYEALLKERNPRFSAEGEAGLRLKDYLSFFRYIYWRIVRLFE